MPSHIPTRGPNFSVVQKYSKSAIILCFIYIYNGENRLAFKIIPRGCNFSLHFIFQYRILIERQSLWKRTNYERTITKSRRRRQTSQKNSCKRRHLKKIHAEGNGLPMKFMHQKFHRIYNYTALAKPKLWVLTFT